MLLWSGVGVDVDGLPLGKQLQEWKEPSWWQENEESTRPPWWAIGTTWRCRWTIEVLGRCILDEKKMQRLYQLWWQARPHPWGDGLTIFMITRGVGGAKVWTQAKRKEDVESQSEEDWDVEASLPRTWWWRARGVKDTRVKSIQSVERFNSLDCYFMVCR